MNKIKIPIHFFYPKGRYLIGQEAASRLILKYLSDRWVFRPHYLPSMDRREKHKLWHFLNYAFRVLCLWAYIITLAFRTNIAVYLNLGQSWNSIFRDGIPFICLRLFRKKMPLVISLHGHWFAEWPRTNWKTRIFIKILSTAKLVVVYNNCQKQHLIELGLKEEGIRMIANTCDIKTLSNDQVTTKHLSASVIRILFLSNLIDSKGYKEFLGMLRLLNNFNCSMHIEAVLCGKIMQAGFLEGSAETKENIESLISEINNDSSIRVLWINGVSDTEKQELFNKTHIFVFPSRIEAQPIVLIEAMASGCAIISSKAGLIPSMLGDNSAVLLENLSPEEIAKQTVNLINNQHKRNSLAQTALERCRNLYSISVFEKSWNNLFIELTT